MRPIRIFEAFAGIGAPHTSVTPALCNRMKIGKYRANAYIWKHNGQFVISFKGGGWPFGWGKTRDEARSDAEEELDFIFKEYVNVDTRTASNDTLIYRKWILENVEVVS